MSDHWALKYIGKDWVAGGRGPEVFDCWGLVVDVYRSALGIELPAIAGVDPKNRLGVTRLMESQEFLREVSVPREYDIVYMGRNNYAHHVGIFTETDSGGIVHAQENTGVVFSSLPWVRAQGFPNLKFFRPRCMQST